MSNDFLAKAQAEAEKMHLYPRDQDWFLCGAQFGYTERSKELEAHCEAFLQSPHEAQRRMAERLLRIIRGGTSAEPSQAADEIERLTAQRNALIKMIREGSALTFLPLVLASIEEVEGNTSAEPSENEQVVPCQFCYSVDHAKDCPKHPSHTCADCAEATKDKDVPPYLGQPALECPSGQVVRTSLRAEGGTSAEPSIKCKCGHEHLLGIQCGHVEYGQQIGTFCKCLLSAEPSELEIPDEVIQEAWETESDYVVDSMAQTDEDSREAFRRGLAIVDAYRSKRTSAEPSEALLSAMKKHKEIVTSVPCCMTGNIGHDGDCVNLRPPVCKNCGQTEGSHKCEIGWEPFTDEAQP